MKKTNNTNEQAKETLREKYAVFVTGEKGKKQLPDDLAGIITVATLGKLTAGYPATTDQVETSAGLLADVAGKIAETVIDITELESGKQWTITGENLAKFAGVLADTKRKIEEQKAIRDTARVQLFESVPVRVRKVTVNLTPDSFLEKLANI